MATTTQKTYTPKASEVTHAWRLVDAQDQTLGRLATQIAGWLKGKHLPTYAEHMDLGDFVVVVNAGAIRRSSVPSLRRPPRRMWSKASGRSCVTMTGAVNGSRRRRAFCRGHMASSTDRN